MRKRLFTLILGLVAGLGLTALQAQKLQAVVIDQASGTPIAGAHVLLQPSVRGAVSDQAGRFTLNSPPSGAFTLLVSILGYNEFKQAVTLTGSDQQLDTIKLQSGPTVLFNNVVVTGQRSLRSGFASTEALTVLDGQQIQRNGSRNLPEALMGVTGVFVQKTNHGGGSPFIRGLTGNQTLLLLDGLRLNNTTYRFGPNQYSNTIDALSIDQIEVLRGAGSVLYGTDAMGGTIQMLTVSPKFSGEGWKTSGRFFGRVLSNDMEYTGRGELQLANERIALHVGYSERSFGDLVAGGDLGTEGPSSYGERGADAKFLFKIGGTGLLTVAYNGLFQRDVERYDQYVTGAKLALFQPQTRQMAYARMAWEDAKPWFQKLSLTASFQDSEEGRIFQRNNSVSRRQENDQVGTSGFVAEWQAAPTTFWQLTAGAEAYFDQVTSTGQDVNTETGAVTTRRGLYPNESNAANLALFASNRLTFGALQADLGLRFNQFTIEFADATFGNTSIDPRVVVGHALLRYGLGQHHALSAGVYTGFRAPNVNDMSTFGRFDFGIEVPSYGLAPERNTTYELGYKMNTTNFSAGVAAFYTDLVDLITRVPGTFQGQPTYQGDRVFLKENVAAAFIRGLEVDVEWKFMRSLALAANLTATYGHNLTANEPVRRIPPLNGRIALTYLPAQKIFAQAEFWYASKQDRLAAGDKSDPRIPKGGTPGWSVLNLRGGYRFGQLALNGGLNNLFNEAYRTHGSGIDGVGRSVWLSLEYKF